MTAEEFAKTWPGFKGQTSILREGKELRPLARWQESVAIRFAEAYAEHLVSSKAAEAPGGPEEQLGVCDQGFAGRLPHPKDCHLTGPCVNWTTWVAPADPSERADEREKFELWCMAEQFNRHYVVQWQNGRYNHGFIQFAWLGWQARAGLSSQEGK